MTPLFGKKNVIVTGGAGFIGTFLCERLLKEDCRVLCIDNFTTSHQENIAHLLKNPDFEFIRHDVNEPIDLEQFPELQLFNLRLQGIQEIYHLACPRTGRRFDKFQLETLLTNSVGLHNVLEVAVKWKSRFFLASSAVVYGPRPEDGHLLKEGEYGTFGHLEPNSCYDQGKQWAETMVDTYRQVHGIDVRIGRIFRTFGPRMPLDDGHLIPDFIQNAMDGKDIAVFGEDLRSSFLYVTDAVDAIILFMQLIKDPGPTNIGSDYDLKIGDVARRIIDLTGSSSRIVVEEPPYYMAQHGLPDLTKAREELGWLPVMTFEQGLKRTIEYTIANRGIVRPENE
ncbi:MAG TPA: NAD-dependent epimerase/dehydratase family protein [Candidatus Eisenbacteria bacterium]|nr:NAD-dependent epimerase/dehydratase family protein [Candidatus Eisenbacteria bacterium]